MTRNLVRKNERIDDLQNGFFVIQDPEKFCFGMDAVLLADFARVRKGEQVLDLGTGTGIIPVLLAARSQETQITGLEIQEECADMAQRTVLYNHLEDRIRIVHGDLKEAVRLMGTASFRVVTCNPPYMIGGHGLANPELPKAIARHEILCTLEDVVKTAAGLLPDHGRFYMVHRPFRLAEIMVVLKEHHLEPKRIRMVYPFVDKEANMVLVEAVKGGNPRVTAEPPLIVYEKPGVYTREILTIYHMEESLR